MQYCDQGKFLENVALLELLSIDYEVFVGKTYKKRSKSLRKCLLMIKSLCSVDIIIGYFNTRKMFFNTLLQV